MSHMMHAVLIVLLIELNLPSLLSLTVEPSLMQTISNTDNYAFGYHTAIYDKTILVNGEGQSETINIYELNETSMEWQNTFNIYNTSIYSGSGKLYKSAIYNNTALISVSGYYDSGNRVGSIFIYEKEYPNTFGSSWKFIDKAIGIDCCPSWVFGWSVSLCEYYFIVGSPDARKAYIYSKNRTTNMWNVDSYVTLTAIYGGSGYFGYDVDITCNENIATAIITQSGSNANYIFEKYYYNDSYETDWEVTGYFDESNTQSGESMRSVSLYNNSIAVVGSKFDNSYKGCVFIYYKNETNNNNYEWIKLTKLTYSGSSSYDYFGTLVDIYNDILLVGDYNDNVYLYQQSANNISQWNFISIMSNWDSNEYDFSISIFNEYAVIGQKDSRTIKIYSQMDLQTSNPTFQPVYDPTTMPSVHPSMNPSNIPTNDPSSIPSDMPTDNPTDIPTDIPTNDPTVFPSGNPIASSTMSATNAMTTASTAHTTMHNIITSSTSASIAVATTSTSDIEDDDDDASDSETNVNDDNSLMSSLSNIVIIIAIICVTILLLVAICVMFVYKERKQERKLNMEKELQLQTSRMAAMGSTSPSGNNSQSPRVIVMPMANQNTTDFGENINNSNNQLKPKINMNKQISQSNIEDEEMYNNEGVGSITVVQS